MRKVIRLSARYLPFANVESSLLKVKHGFRLEMVVEFQVRGSMGPAVPRVPKVLKVPR